MGGKTYRAILGGGERTIERALRNWFWRAQKVGLVWSVPVPSNMTGCELRGGNRIIGGGFQNRFWGGVLWYIFLLQSFSPPLSLNPNPYNLSKKYGSTLLICTALRPPIVSSCFPGF